jgi:hypothetical protein
MNQDSYSLRGNGTHMTYATYMVYVVQKCSMYGRLYDGFVRTWKSTFRGYLHVSESAYESQYDSVHDS